MGNVISSANDAINPTYDISWSLKYGIVIVTKNNARYDFEELPFTSYDEAIRKQNVVRKLGDLHSVKAKEISYLRDKISTLEKELEAINFEIKSRI